MKRNNKKSLTALGLLHALAALTALTSVVSLLDVDLLWFELLSHFRLQYLLSSLLCLVALIGLRSYKSGLAMVLVVALNAVYVVPWFFAQQVDQSATGADLTVMHANVNTGNTAYEQLLKQVGKEQPDILVVQEVNQAWLNALAQVQVVLPYHYSVPRDDNFGIALFSRFPLLDVRELYLGNSGVPSLQATLALSDRRISLVTTHPLPPINSGYFRSRNSQLTALAGLAAGISEPLIVMGDLNVTMWSANYTPLELDHLDRKTGLVNGRRGFGILPTWPAALLPLFRIPIDHCLVSPHFVVEEMRVGKKFGSDHLPLISRLRLK